MQIRISVAARGSDPVDVVVEAPLGATVAGVRDELAAALGVKPDTALWSGRRLLTDAAVVGGPGLQPGDVISLDRPPSDAVRTDALLHLAVTGGPSAGLVAPLTRGVHVIGRGGDCDLKLADDDVSRQHAALTVSTAGVTLRDLSSTNGTRCEGRPVDPDGVDLVVEQAVRLGDSTVVLRAGGDPPPALRPTGDGRVVVVRSPRAEHGDHPAELRTPEPPPDRSRPRVSWIGALLPAVAGVGLAWFLHTWQFLAFAALTPLTVLGTAAGDRWSWRAGRRRAAARYADACAELTLARAAGLGAEQAARRRAHPDPAGVVHTATAPGSRLWERRLDHPDALCVRIGTADRPSRLLLRAPTGGVEPAGVVHDVPVLADLRVGPLGLAGPRDRVDGVVRSVLGDLVTAHSPADLDVVLLLSDGVDTDWKWLQWLPHRVGLAAGPAARAHLLADLEVRLRAAANLRDPVPRGRGGPWTVVVIDRVGVLSDHPVLTELFARGPLAHLAAICLDETPSALPGACASVAVTAGATGSRWHLGGTGWSPAPAEADVVGPVIGDRVDSGWAERLARGLAPFADPAGDSGAALPDSVRLLDLLGREGPDPVGARWRGRGRATDPLRVPIGAGRGGVVELDLTADGPHALVAGTTGSGKSELLQSLVAGLAVRFAPDDVSMLLVDYKGGAAFGACTRLPHVLGLVTDLDPHLTRRVLRSLDAELTRRERLLAASGAADLVAHRRRADATSLPRLLIVVDEFATLAADLPDFVPGLVDVAQRGRSLGVHLVLATQRPGTAVSPAIRANATLRIALRVSDPGESLDVIDVPDAAGLDPARPGRAVVRDGRGVVELQTARVTGPARDRLTPVRVAVVAPWQAAPDVAADHDAVTDLDLLVGTVSQAWSDRLATGVTAPAPTWLPALPDVVPLSPGPASGPQLVIGLRDLPGEQRRVDEVIDLAAGGTTLVVGSGRSGRTGLMRTVVASALAAGAVAVVVDGSGALAGFADTPGLLAHVRAADADALARLLDQLDAECAARQSSGPATLSPLLLVVDGWETCQAALDDLDAGRATARLLALLRVAGSIGWTVLLTGDRSLLGPRVAACADRMYLLRLTDQADYAMAGVPARDVPTSRPPGRAVVVPGGHEVQLGVLGPDPDPAAQWREVRRLREVPAAPAVGTRSTSTGLGLRGLPDRVDAASLPPAAAPGLTIGIGGDQAAPVVVDPWAGGGRWLVVGPPRSGRSSVLVQLAHTAQAAGVSVVWVARPHSPLAGWARTQGLAPLTPALRDLPSVRGGRALVLLDDADDLQDTPLGDAVADALRQLPPGELAVVCAGRPDELAMSYRGVVAEVRRARRGLLLRPGPGDGELIGVRTGRFRTGSPPGRGLLVADGLTIGGRARAAEPVAVQIAWREVGPAAAVA